MKTVFRLARHIWKLILLILLVTVTFSYTMFQGGFVSWFLFYSFLPFALYALGIAVYSLNGFSIERQLSKREFHAYEDIIVKVNVKRNSAFPLLFLIAEDCLNEQLASSVINKKNKILLFPGFKKELSFQYVIENVPRGEHLFNNIRIYTSDIFGLIEKEKGLQREEKILVYPYYKEISYSSLTNQMEQGNMTSTNELLQKDTTMAVGIREYQHGDRFSWINWKASAKRNEMMIKEFEQKTNQDAFIIMDSSPNPNFEQLVSLTASLGRAILVNGSRLGFLNFAQERTVLPFQSGEACQRILFYHLARSKDVCKTSFAQLLQSESFLSQYNATFMLVTSNLNANLIEKAGIFTSRKCNVIIFLVKGNEDALNASEISLKNLAQVRGIRVITIYGHSYSMGLLEVEKE